MRSLPPSSSRVEMMPRSGLLHQYFPMVSMTFEKRPSIGTNGANTKSFTGSITNASFCQRSGNPLPFQRRRNNGMQNGQHTLRFLIFQISNLTRLEHLETGHFFIMYHGMFHGIRVLKSIITCKTSYRRKSSLIGRGNHAKLLLEVMRKFLRTLYTHLIPYFTNRQCSGAQ